MFVFISSLWTKVGNLTRLLFGMKICLDVGFLHTTGLFSHQISKKNQKGHKYLKAKSKARKWKNVHFLSKHDHMKQKKIKQCLWFEPQGHKDHYKDLFRQITTFITNIKWIKFPILVHTSVYGLTEEISLTSDFY